MGVSPARQYQGCLLINKQLNNIRVARSLRTPIRGCGPFINANVARSLNE